VATSNASSGISALIVGSSAEQASIARHYPLLSIQARDHASPASSAFCASSNRPRTPEASTNFVSGVQFVGGIRIPSRPRNFLDSPDLIATQLPVRHAVSISGYCETFSAFASARFRVFSILSSVTRIGGILASIPYCDTTGDCPVPIPRGALLMSLNFQQQPALPTPRKKRTLEDKCETRA
jgi:hypothetical protein